MAIKSISKSELEVMSVGLYKADKDSVASSLGGTTDPKNVSLKETVKQFEAQGFKKKES
ncbi:TPA_asm: DUF1307 domain-containing protein [Listeria monocytogenes]|nr:DUF1307 domain-containing protein [Listeria monocytogenes]